LVSLVVDHLLKAVGVAVEKHSQHID